MKPNLKPPSGFIEYSPSEQKKFDKLKNQIEANYSKLGFQKTETPAAEHLSNLLAKGACDQELFTIGRYGHDKQPDIGLRFDLTVPFARYIAAYQTEITFPFKRYQIDPVWRGERAQSGRYRQFYQCDVDIIAPENLSKRYDAFILYSLVDTLKSIQISDICLKVNDKRLLEEVGLFFGVDSDQSSEFYRLIDKKDKISQALLIEELSKLISKSDAENLVSLFENLTKRSLEDAINYLSEYFQSRTQVLTILDEIRLTLDHLQAFGVNLDIISLDLSIARGLNYYTGIIFETTWLSHRELGSIASGGRYNDLVNFFSKRPYRGIGFSIGLSRIFSSYCVTNTEQDENLRGLVICVDKNCSTNELEKLYSLQSSLVETCDFPIDIYLQEKKKQNQIKYAKDKSMRYFISINREQETSIEETIYDLSDLLDKKIFSLKINEIMDFFDDLRN